MKDISITALWTRHYWQGLNSNWIKAGGFDPILYQFWFMLTDWNWKVITLTSMSPHGIWKARALHYYCDMTVTRLLAYKNIERHTAHTIVSWPNRKQWVIVHTSDLMMIIRQSMYILSIITKEMGKRKTRSPTYCIMDNWGNMLNLTHTLDKLYLTGIL